jgi:EmrB/QacA subfamily drug resistance transporter
MSSIDGNILLIALPTIAKDLLGTSILQSSLFDLLWILLGYQLVTAVVLVNFGRLGDMFGKVKLYTFGFVLFTVGSALCGFSQSSLQLILFRIVQALGGALLFANSAAIITDAFPVNERGRALGINSVAFVVGSVLGLVLGGILTVGFGWRSIFLVNVPIGIFATIWSHYRLKELGELKRDEKLDIWGNVTLAASLAILLLAITLASIAVIEPFLFYLSAFIGASMFVAFIMIERRAECPMLDLGLFKNRLFSAGNIAIFLNALARGALSLVLIFYLQGPTMGLDPLTAGLYLLPLSASIAVLGPISGWISDKRGARALATSGLLISSGGFLLLTQIGETVTFGGLLPPLVLIGAGMGLFTSPNRASIMNSVPPDARGLASGTSATLINVGATFSLGLSFAAMTVKTPILNLTEIFLGVSGLGSAPWIGDFINSIRLVYLISTVFLLVAIVPSALRGPPPSKQQSLSLVRTSQSIKGD